MPAAKSTPKNKNFAARPEADWQAEEEHSVHNHHYHIKPRHQFDFGKLAFGLILIILGLVYLGVNQGWLPPETKPDLWKLWPLLIVFAGLSMITGYGLASFLTGSIITITVLAVSVLLVFGDINWMNQKKLTDIYQESTVDKVISSIQDINIPLNNIDNLLINQQNGRLDLSGGGTVLTGQLDSNSSKLTQVLTGDDGTTALNLSIEELASQPSATVNSLKLQIPEIKKLIINNLKNTFTADWSTMVGKTVISDTDSDTALTLGVRNTDLSPAEIIINQQNSRLKLNISKGITVRLRGLTATPNTDQNWRKDGEDYLIGPKKISADYMITINLVNSQLMTEIQK